MTTPTNPAPTVCGTIKALEWRVSKGGALVSGPYMVAERIDGKGWSASALFERPVDHGEPTNFSTTILLAGTKSECIAACDNANSCILASIQTASAQPVAWRYRDARNDKSKWTVQKNRPDWWKGEGPTGYVLEPLYAAPVAGDAVSVQEALRYLLHAVCGETGFAACVRRDSGHAYPWPALDIAEEMSLRALGGEAA